MTIEDPLLQKARAAGERLAQADRDALLARAEYHTAVRRLHLAGGSLREIAATLGMSHQRVQQIVDAAGGSWWQRIWRTRTPRRDAVCSFCERPPSEVKRLVAGPNVYLCDECIARAAQRRTSRKGKCSFCGKRNAPVVSQHDTAVCAACLKTCRDIADATLA